MNALRDKLVELELKRKMMLMDKNVKEEKIIEIDNLINEAKREIAKTLYEEKIQENGQKNRNR